MLSVSSNLTILLTQNQSMRTLQRQDNYHVDVDGVEVLHSQVHVTLVTIDGPRGTPCRQSSQKTKKQSKEFASLRSGETNSQSTHHGLSNYNDIDNHSTFTITIAINHSIHTFIHTYMNTYNFNACLTARLGTYFFALPSRTTGLV